MPQLTSNSDDETNVVLITGCGSNIGRSIAVTFARLGLKIALVDFNTEQTEFIASECEERSPKHLSPLQIVADISQLDQAHKVIDQTIKEYGRLDVLVNTVNITGLSKFDDPHVFEQYHKIIAQNMHSVTYLCLSAAPYLRRTKGSIINVSSILNNTPGFYKFAYCMSKAGISVLTKCLATDLAPDIRVVCVCPNIINSWIQDVLSNYDNHHDNIIASNTVARNKKISTDDKSEIITINDNNNNNIIDNTTTVTHTNDNGHHCNYNHLLFSHLTCRPFLDT